MKKKSQPSTFADSLTHRLIKGGSIVLFFALASTPIGYLTKMWYSRTLSIEMFGLFYSMIGILTVLSVFNDLGFGYSVTYFVPKYLKKKRLQTVWNIFQYNQIVELVSATTISILLILLAPWLTQHYFKVDEAQIMIYIFAFFLIADSFQSALDKFLTGLQQEMLFASMRFARLCLVFVFSLAFWLGNYRGIYYYAIAWVIAYLLTSVGYKLLLRYYNPNLPRKITWDKPLLKKMWQYAWPTLMLASVGLIGTSIDTTLLVLFRDVKTVGIYSVVLPLVVISPIFLSPINSLILPLISKLEDEPTKVQQLLEILLKIIPYIALYFGLFIFLFPRGVIQTVFGSKWMELSHQPLMLASLSYVLLPVTSFLSTAVNGLGLIKEKVKINTSLAVTKVITNLILIYLLGIVGAIIANLLLFLLSIGLLAHLIRKKINFKFPIQIYGSMGVLIALAVILTKTFNINPYGIPQLVVSGVGYTIIYLVYGYLVNIIDKQTLGLIIKERRNFNFFRIHDK